MAATIVSSSQFVRIANQRQCTATFVGSAKQHTPNKCNSVIFAGALRVQSLKIEEIIIGLSDRS